MPLVEMRSVVKRYGRGDAAVTALAGVDFDVDVGEFVAVLGRSGSGKSTLMNILAGLDRADEGEVRVSGDELSTLDATDLANYRATCIGIVFQSFHLLPGRTAAENVEMPLVLDGVTRAERRRRAAEALAAVGLSARADHVPSQLSGGEQQRVAIARALVRRPPLLLCDEPTGNLDSATALEVMELLATLRRRLGATIVMITHEPDLADRFASRRVTMQDGRIVDHGVAAPESYEEAPAEDVAGHEEPPPSPPTESE
jgi:putative ABC transport system ATP-binding protein